MTQIIPHRLLKTTFAVGILSLTNFGFAQTEESEKEVLTLSPFEVTADDYSGYEANTTQAGSRLNSKVSDLASAITIMTPDFMQDIGATNLQDALAFAPNTEFQEFRDVNPDNQATFRSTVYRVRGFEGARGGQSRGFFRTDVSADIYNTERLTFSRGPNSILYGSGAVYGIIDNAPKQARYGTSMKQIDFKTDAEGTLRFTWDSFHELMKEKLAVRVALLNEDKKSWHVPAKNNSERFYIAARFDPFANTTIHANFEHTDDFATSVTPFVPNGNYQKWIDAGRPLYDASVGGAFPEGTQAAGSNTLVSQASLGGSTPANIFNRNGTAISSGYRVDGFDLYVPDQNGLYSEGIVPFAPVQTRLEKAKIFSASLEQRISKSFTVLLAYNREKMDFNTRIGNITPVVYFDVNSKFKDGSVNPYAGQPYFENGTARWNFQPRDTETLRATAAYDLDLTERNKWLGRHRIAALIEHEEFEIYHDKFDLRNTTPAAANAALKSNFSSDITNRQNEIMSRHYFTPGDFASTTTPNYFDFDYFGTPRDLGNGVNALYARTRGPNHDFYETDTLAISAQSFFLEEKLITTLGVRSDAAKQFSADAVRGSDKQFVSPYETDLPTDPTQDLTFNTKSIGAVYKATPWLSFTYNQSDNISRLSSRRNYFGNTQPAPKGEGEDYGFRLNLLDEKLNISITKFTTTLVGEETLGLRNAAGGAKLSIPDNISLIQETLNPSIYAATLSDISNISFLNDIAAKGTEISVIYNPNKRWRIAFNAGQKENIQTNIGSDVDDYLDLYRSEFVAAAGQALNSPDASKGILTVGDALADAEKTLAFRQLNEGRTSAAEREWTANFVTSYDLPDDSPLKGVRIGATSNWGSKASIGYYKDANGNFDVNRPIYGGERFDLGLFARYSRRVLNGKATLSLQINIRNVLNDRLTAVEAAEDRFGEVGPVGEIVNTRYLLRDPRSFELSSSLKF